MDGGSERIDDARELATVRGQARRVLFRSFLATGAVVIGLILLA